MDRAIIIPAEIFTQDDYTRNLARQHLAAELANLFANSDSPHKIRVAMIFSLRKEPGSQKIEARPLMTDIVEQINRILQIMQVRKKCEIKSEPKFTARSYDNTQTAFCTLITHNEP